MIIKAVTFFLIFMLVLGMFGKLRMPKIGLRQQKQLMAEKCEKCGTKIAKGSSCPCTKSGKS